MVYKTVYTIAWYKLPISLNTEIHLLILRSQKPSKITAGKFYVMHLENFTGVRNHKIMEFFYMCIYIYIYIHTHNILILIFTGIEHSSFILHVAP